MQTVSTYYLEMTSPSDLRAKSPVAELQIMECEIRQFEYSRFLYTLVGGAWGWTDKLSWSDEQWRDYAENENLRTWVAYFKGSPAGYFELQKQPGRQVEISYFGLAPKFIGQGLGGYLLTQCIREAWNWDAERVWVHTCTLDHPGALANYQARGMRLYLTETD
ncbi:Histone acetyltransferase HPA2/related acetyltransferase [Hahella chejuensis KCTC 2396]|uniref:Histone acetyltransferase HPA2/related acetyltransferase n=1 Tax=Hahella chejuensis (strain KCTC 2396) TaxID=349521 RepID=Q2SQD1_HAHCH|nr:GNAT family N-acetyltransferase [Hahella chejuensis]ABC27143.1 Histone acetyltransferase HPA2/related acetyltransferase [Hahella chejuensis KCTC 2396]